MANFEFKNVREHAYWTMSTCLFYLKVRNDKYWMQMQMHAGSNKYPSSLPGMEPWKLEPQNKKVKRWEIRSRIWHPTASSLSGTGQQQQSLKITDIQQSPPHQLFPRFKTNLILEDFQLPKVKGIQSRSDQATSNHSTINLMQYETFKGSIFLLPGKQDKKIG